MNMPDFIDTHCHLNHKSLSSDLDRVLRRAAKAGVSRIVCPGYDIESSEKAVRLAIERPGVFAAVGIHPHDASDFNDGMRERLVKLASEGCVAVGETGLDYFRELSPRDAQQEAFRGHIGLAKELNLPLIVHSRDAQEDVIRILAEEGLPPKGVVMHCLTADPDFAEASIEMGCCVGLGGVLTFGNGRKLRDIAKSLPMHKILLETDAPYVTPHPHRGKRNEPSYLPLTAAALADVMGLTIEEVASVTSANAEKFFGL